MNLSELLLVVGFILGNIYKFSLFSPDIKINLLDLVIFVLIFSNLKKITSLIKLKPLKPYLVTMALFSFICLSSLVLKGYIYGLQAQLVGLLYLLRWVAYTSAFLIFIDRPPSLLLIGGATAIVGYVQYFLIPDTRFLQLNNWDPHFFRLIGSFLDPGFTGIILVFTLVYLTLHPLKHWILNTLSWATVYMAIALTYSRSSYIAFLFGIGFISIKRKSYPLLVLSLLAMFLTYNLLPRPAGEGVNLERTSTIEARIINWKNSFKIFSQNPFLGTGFNVYRYVQKNQGLLPQDDWLENHAGAGADSSLLFVAATTGVIGLVCYLFYLIRLFKLPNLNYYVIPLLAHSLFLNSLFYPAVLVWLSILVAKEYKIPSVLS
jgi:O-antigen ligase